MASPSKNTKQTLVFMLPLLCPGGAERVLITLMNNIDRDKFTPHMITLETGEAQSWITPDIPVHNLGTKKVTRSIFALRRKLKEIQPDIIISTIVHMNLLAILMKPFFPSTRFFLRESSLPNILIHRYGIKGRACELIYKYAYPHADTIISPAQIIIDEFTNDLKITKANHALLLNPVDTQRIRGKLPKQFEPSSTIKQDTRQFICTGRLAREKGFQRLIKALANTPLTKPWHLTIVGDGELKDELQTLINTHDLGQNITLSGYQDNPWNAMSKADAFLLPSRWEGMPNAALESLVCGTPVISMQEAGGIVEIAAQSAEGDVKLAKTIKEFVGIMDKVEPKSKETPAPSRLPKAFQLKSVSKQFEKILAGAGESR